MIDVERQVEAAAFLAGFDHNRAARMRDRLRLQRADSREAREHRIAVVRGAASIKAAVLQHRRPRSETRVPSGHLGLLVHVPIEQDAVVRGARNIDEQKRRAALKPHHLQREALDRLASGPFAEARHHLFHVAVRAPFGIEGRRFVGDANVFGQLGQDRFIPQPLDVGLDGRLIHGEPAYSYG